MRPLFKKLQIPVWVDRSTTPLEEELLVGRPGPARSIRYYEVFLPLSTFLLYSLAQVLTVWTCRGWPSLVGVWLIGICLLIAVRNRYGIHQQSPKTALYRNVLMLVDLTMGGMTALAFTATWSCVP